MSKRFSVALPASIWMWQNFPIVFCCVAHLYGKLDDWPFELALRRERWRLSINNPDVVLLDHAINRKNPEEGAPDWKVL